MRLRRPGGLWRHRDFRNLWSAETVSQVGSQVSAIALPLVAIIVLEASAFEVALLGVIEFAPFILISLPAGVWSTGCGASRSSSPQISVARSCSRRSRSRTGSTR